jgi:superfamily I DNA and RNA helicase
VLDIVYGKKSNQHAVEVIVKVLREQDWEGTLYVGYPVFGGDDSSSVTDALLTCVEHGVVVFDLSSQDFIDVHRDEMNSVVKGRQRDLRRKLNSRLVGYEELLLEDEMTLGFKIEVLSLLPYAVPNLDGLSTVTQETLLDQIEAFPALPRHYFKPLNAAVQKTAALKPKKKRLNVRKSDSMGAVMKQIESEIANLDRWQKNAAIESPEGPQRIRGLAGSGKTIILALKAAYLHANDPHADIIVTFNTRSLYQQFKSLIRRFYFDQVSDEPNWNKLRIMHAWGSEVEAGVYSQISALAHATPIPFGVARHRFGYANAFGGVCENLVQHLKSTGFEPMVDYMLIDEAQDFPSSFFQLAYLATKPPKRIVWAYDELQNLNDSTMPTLDQLFGIDEDGNTVIDISNDEGQPKRDILLPVCYRNPPWLLTTALGLGLGIKRNGGKFAQMFTDPEFWREVGYTPVDGQLAHGAPVRLHRDADRSAPFFGEVLSPDDSVSCRVFQTAAEQAAWVAADINRALSVQELDANDILVVIPDAIAASKISIVLSDELKKYSIKSHLVGVTGSRDSVFVDQSIAMSGIFRAKGNEAPLVYVIHAEYCEANLSDLSRRRNILFTAITRAKAWVRICGVGLSMQLIANEISEIVADDYDLKFIYPTLQQLEKIKTSYKERTFREKRQLKVEVNATERLLQRLLNGDMNLDELPPNLAEILRKGIR